MLVALGAYHYAKSEFAEQVIAMQSDADIRWSTLNNTIENKLTPMATQVEEVKEQLPELSERVDSATQTASAAAVRSTKAANTARQAMRKPAPIYIPHGSPGIRIKKAPGCIGVKDIYNDPC